VGSDGGRHFEGRDGVQLRVVGPLHLLRQLVDAPLQHLALLAQHRLIPPFGLLPEQHAGEAVLQLPLAPVADLAVPAQMLRLYLRNPHLDTQTLHCRLQSAHF
jgi:hypothetical protein